MEQISRKDVADYRDDQEELEAWRITERRRQEEAFLQRIRDEAAGLGRHLKSTPPSGCRQSKKFVARCCIPSLRIPSEEEKL